MSNRVFLETALSASKYFSFLTYCRECNYVFVDEISPIDFVAYKSLYSCSSEFILCLKSFINNIIAVNISPDIHENMEETTELPCSEDMDDDIMLLNLSVRSTNALRNAGITKVSQVLTIEEENLVKIKNLGTKSINEILLAKEKYAEMNMQRYYSYQTQEPFFSEKALSHNVKVIINNILYKDISEKTTWVRLSKAEQQIVDVVVEGVNILGKELALEACTTPGKVRPVINMLNAFCYQIEQEKELHEYFNLIPKTRLNKSIDSFLKAFKPIKTSEIRAVNSIRALMPNSKTVADIKSVFPLIQTYQQKTAIIILLNYLAVDLRDKLVNAISETLSSQKERSAYVLRQRCNGETLQTIAEQLNLTRERVRQIELKMLKKLKTSMANICIDPLTFISAERNEDDILTIDEILDYMGIIDDAPVFLRVLMDEGISEFFDYETKFKAFVMKGTRADITKVFEAIDSFPQLIRATDVNLCLLDASEKQGIPVEILEIEFHKRYKVSKSICYKGSLSLANIYRYILENYYPAGIKIYDDAETERFKQCIFNVFGNIELPDNNRAINIRLTDVSVLCDRGTYIHPKYIVIDKEILDEINRYITDGYRSVISFNELFEQFKDTLQLSSNVSNRYFLQGVMKYFLNDRFYFTRDYISKEKGASLNSEIEAFVLKKGILHKRDIFDKFAGITEIMLSMQTNINKNIIALDNGCYMHSSLLDINECDYDIRQIIEQQISVVPVSVRKLLQLLWLTHPDFLIRNNITEHGKLFGILRYMFGNDYAFSRPYIAQLGTQELTNIAVIMKHIERYNEISISELLDICTENRLKFSTTRNLIRGLNTGFIRTDMDLLQHIGDDFLDEDTIQKIAGILTNEIEKKGYVVASKIDDFMFYPDVPYTWNAYLLRSIVEKYLSDIICVIDLQTTDTFSMTAVFVDTLLDIEGYEDLLRNVLITEHNKEDFHSIDEAVDWLRQEGFFNLDPPKCVTDGSIIRIDDFGKVLIE